MSERNTSNGQLEEEKTSYVYNSFSQSENYFNDLLSQKGLAYFIISHKE
tara:strand:+ start:672 stop:818 length:147 start_codon:yes stop_codon:yes gene_type:complete